MKFNEDLDLTPEILTAWAQFAARGTPPPIHGSEDDDFDIDLGEIDPTLFTMDLDVSDIETIDFEPIEDRF